MRVCSLMFAAILVSAAGATSARAAELPLPAPQVAALAKELSGDTAKRNLEVITQFHRQRGSRGFHSAAEHVAAQLKAYGLADVEILRFPTDGKTMYGTQ